MSDPRPDLFRAWFAHERTAHDRVLASLETVPAEGRDADHGAAVDLLAHMAAARHLWLHRLGGVETGPEDLFPRGVPLAEVRATLEAIQAAWEGYLERLDADELERRFTYRAFEGPAFRSRVEDVLAQLNGHSWYHRGQIAQTVRRLGGEPARTDYVFSTRERVEDGG